ncbi:MAG: ATP-binding protein [Promethearchaeota archaeon]|nr:MAG: ATP-binding protein [Candidatus Lokiarchaeota archaeon]
MKVALSWSGGKDSSLALFEVQNNPSKQVDLLFTTISQEYERISMHGIRKELLEEQANRLHIPLKTIKIPVNCSNEEYNAIMKREMSILREEGFSAVVFGDIFLEDIRAYRERNLSRVKMNAIFPLWNRNTDELAREFIDLGFEAIITCIDSHFLEKSFIGRFFDYELLEELPENVDPCGEKGEFHTFVFNGPNFKTIPFSKGQIKFERKRYYFIDLISGIK